MVKEDNFKTNATLQEWQSNVLLDSSSVKANRRTKRFSHWVRRWLRSRPSHHKKLYQVDVPPVDPIISCRFVPDHVAHNIFDAMYAIELNIGKLEANKLYNSAKNSSVDQVQRLSESLLSSTTHQSDYQATLNHAHIDAAYTLGEAVKHTLSLFSPFVPFSIREKFNSIADEKDAMTFLDFEDWSRYPEKLVMGIFIHLSKISAIISRKSKKHKMFLFSLSSIFSEILLPKEVPFTDQSSDERMVHSTNAIRLSLILQCIHGMMSTDPASFGLKECELSSQSDTVETEKSSVISTTCSPIHIDCGCDFLISKENAPRPPQEQKIQFRIREYQELIERAESRIQSAKVTSIKIEQALYNSHVGGHMFQKNF